MIPLSNWTCACLPSKVIFFFSKHLKFRPDTSHSALHCVRQTDRHMSVLLKVTVSCLQYINPLNAELNPICYLLALLGAHHFLHVSRIRVK